MLFMVIERFRPGAREGIGERFRQKGRMLPDGVAYHASWIDPAREVCFQVMEAPDVGLLEAWARNWDDLVDFEIIPVVSSRDYWDAPNPAG